MTSPSSQLPSPGPLWPPPRIAVRSSFSRAKAHGGNNVGHVGAAGDEERPLVNHRVVELAGLVVVRVASPDELPRRPALNLSIVVVFNITLFPVCCRVRTWQATLGPIASSVPRW